jgi:site-specific recombinase XerD
VTPAPDRARVRVRVYFNVVRPFVDRWAADHQHPREITPHDIEINLKPLRGNRLHNAITALRSLFRFATRHHLIFTDPTARLAAPSAELAGVSAQLCTAMA